MSKGKGQLLEQNYYKKGHVKIRKRKSKITWSKACF